MWEEAKKAIANSSADSSVYIGCDSIRFRQNGDWMAKYSTVVIVHKNSRHGCKIFYNSQTLRDYGKGVEGLRNRLITEVGFAVEAASDVLDVLDGRPLEVHLDLNPDPMHKSNVAVKEAVGWVLGMGMTPVIKPDSWAATHAADHCVRSKGFAHG